MVKRLRRRPLTAESGVRFPMGVPKKTSPLGLVFFIRCLQRHVINACVVCNCNRCVSPMAYCTLCVRNLVARTPEHWAGASLYEKTHSFRYFTITRSLIKPYPISFIIFYVLLSVSTSRIAMASIKISVLTLSQH